MSRARDVGIALLVLGVTWVTLFLLLWVIIVVEPVVIPRWFYLPGLAVTVLFGTLLVASKRWAGVWNRTFVPTIPLPPWLWIAGGVATVVILVLSVSYDISLGAAVATGVLVGACLYTGSLPARTRQLHRIHAWPIWIALLGASVFVLVVGLTIVVDEGSLLGSIFLIALLLFAFHVLVILPLTLYEYVRRGEDPTPAWYPPLTVIIPAYNEEGYVGACIEAVLDTTYPRRHLEVIVIDDGSSDATYAEATAYRSEGVKVFSRENGGKHAALNFGLVCASGSIIATVDADSRPAPGAIEHMVAQLLENPEIGGLSAAVLAQNDAKFIGRLQRVEYVLSNTNRRAYSVFDAVPVVPGCLGVYRREALEDVWGYDPDTVTEDFDLTIKLLKAGWRVKHGAGLVWTIAPSSWRALWRQRLRWYQGGLETLRKHRDVLLDPRYRHVHAISFPARIVSHLFTPIASYVILIAVVVGFLTNPTWYLVALVGLFFVLTLLITLYSLVVEREPLSELVYAPLLFVGYKHVVDGAIAAGSVLALRGSDRW